MAHSIEPMDIDSSACDFDNKENSLHHSNVLSRTPCTEKGYEELDVTEISMKLRYSITPPSSPMSKSFTANSNDNKNYDSGDNANLNNDNANLTRSFNSAMTKTDNPFKPKSLPLQPLQTEFGDGNRNVLHLLDSTVTYENPTTMIDRGNGIEENLSLPSSSSSTAHTPEATTPTTDIQKADSSPIIRGLKSVLNMFRPSQSPIPMTEDKTEKLEISSPPVINSPQNTDSRPASILASTPLAAHKGKETLPKTNISNRESLVFNEDLETELQWKDETTILFSGERTPIHKLFPHLPRLLDTKPMASTTEKHDEELDETTEYMDVSYNDSLVKDKTITERYLNETQNKSTMEYDEFLDCETSFAMNESLQYLEKSENGLQNKEIAKLNANNHQTNAALSLKTSDVPDAASETIRDINTTALETVPTPEKAENITKVNEFEVKKLPCAVGEFCNIDPTVPLDIKPKFAMENISNQQSSQIANAQCDVTEPVELAVPKEVNVSAIDQINEMQITNVSTVINSVPMPELGVSTISQIPLIADPRVLLFNITSQSFMTEEQMQEPIIQTAVNTSPADVPLPDDDDIEKVSLPCLDVIQNEPPLNEIREEFNKSQCDPIALPSIETATEAKPTDTMIKHMNELSDVKESVSLTNDTTTRVIVKLENRHHSQNEEILNSETNLNKVQILSQHDTLPKDDITVQENEESSSNQNKFNDKPVNDKENINNTVIPPDEDHVNFAPIAIDNVIVSDTYIPKNEIVPDLAVIEKQETAPEAGISESNVITVLLANKSTEPTVVSTASIVYPDTQHEILETDVNDIENQLAAVDESSENHITENIHCSGIEQSLHDTYTAITETDKLNTGDFNEKSDSLQVENVNKGEEIPDSKTTIVLENLEKINMLSETDNGDKNTILSQTQDSVDVEIKDVLKTEITEINKEDDILKDIQHNEDTKIHLLKVTDALTNDRIATEPISVENITGSVVFNSQDFQTNIASEVTEVRNTVTTEESLVKCEISKVASDNMLLFAEINKEDEILKDIQHSEDTKIHLLKVTDALTNDIIATEPISVENNTGSVLLNSQEVTEVRNTVTIEESLVKCEISKVVSDNMLRSDAKEELIDEEIVASESNSPFVSVSAEDIPESRQMENFTELETLSSNNDEITLPNSPAIVSKGYNFNFDDIEDPFATKVKIRMSPSPEATSNVSFDQITENNAIKTEVHKKGFDKSKRKPQSERKKQVASNKKINSSYSSSPSIDDKIRKQNLETIQKSIVSEDVNMQITKEDIIVGTAVIPPEIKNEIPTDPDKNEKIIPVVQTTATDVLSIPSQADKKPMDEEVKTERSMEIFIAEKEPSVELLSETKNTSSSEHSAYYSAGSSSNGTIESKNVFNLPEIGDLDFNPFVTKARVQLSPQPSIQINDTIYIKNKLKCSPDFSIGITQNDETYSVDKSTENEEQNSSSGNANTTYSSDNSGDKNVTVCEVHTEDEDTIEGPFLEAEDLNDGKVPEFASEDVDVIQSPELPAQISDDNEAGELFIDAEAYEFLLNQNRDNVVTDSGRESLFLKFDPLFAKRMSSIGFDAALNKPPRSTPKKAKPPNDMTFLEKSPATDPSNVNVTRDMSVENVTDESSEDFNTTVTKPMMVVTPRNKPTTPVRSSNRRSLTFTSPAIAVIDRLLSMSANNSLLETTVTEVNRDQIEADLALTQFRELLADKEITLYNLRSESKELKEKLTVLESQMKTLESVREEKLQKIDELTEKLNEKTKSNNSMVMVVEEYERTIAALIAELEQVKKLHAEERIQLIKERDEQVAHLTSMEVSFSDLHAKYEKSKQVIFNLKANEDSLKKSLKEFDDNFTKVQNNYELLKQHATSKLNHANDELQKMNRAHETEVLKLNAMIKRKELHISSLEETLSQKTKANQELTAICDDLLNRVG